MGKLTKKDLQQIQVLHRQLMRDTDQLCVLNELASGLGSKPLDDVYVQSSPPTSSGNRFAEAAADLEVVIQEEEAVLNYLQTLVKEFMRTLEDSSEVRIMRLRYLECYNWMLISSITGYTERHVFRLHNKIIEDLPNE